MKRPLGIVALLYGGGLWLADITSLPLSFLFPFTAAVAAAALLARHARRWLVPVLILFTAWTNLASRTAVISPNDLRVLLGTPAEQVTLHGELADMPGERVYLRAGREVFRTLLELDVTGVEREGTCESAHGRVIVLVNGTLHQPASSGQSIAVFGVIAPPKPAAAPGLFDYANYLRRQGIYFQLQADPADVQFNAKAQSEPCSARFLRWAQDTLAFRQPQIDKPVRLLWAMTLGSRNALPQDAYEPFVRNGTMHLFAISGLHLALIAAILVALCRIARIPREWCGLVVIPLIWFYTSATGWQASAVRATLMTSIVVGGWMLKRPVDLLNSLAAAALILLVFDPQQIFQAGFQLSFLVVLSLALMLPPLERWRDRLLRHDPFLPAELIPRWQRWSMAIIRPFTTAFITSLAAWLGAWPLTAFYFHVVSPATLPCNLVLVPLGSLALASSLGSLVCGNWLPVGTELFNSSAWFWMWTMTALSEWSVQIPGSFLFVRAPGLMQMAVYYAALFAVLSGIAFRPKWRGWIALTMLTAIGVLISQGWWQRDRTEIAILPFSGGSAVFCDAPGRDNDLLVDCGNATAYRLLIEPFLQSQGVNALPHVAFSHGDIDATGGAMELLEHVPVGRVITSAVRFRSANYRALIRHLEREPDKWARVQAGDTLGGWDVLHPVSTNRFSHANDSALVLRGNFKGTRILLLSELGAEGQEALLNSGANLDADIVVAGIPEGGEPINDALLNAICPSLLVIADSDFPPAHRCSSVDRARLSAHGKPVIFTRDEGPVGLQIRNGGWTARTRLREVSSGDSRRAPRHESLLP